MEKPRKRVRCKDCLNLEDRKCQVFGFFPSTGRKRYCEEFSRKPTLKRNLILINPKKDYWQQKLELKKTKVKNKTILDKEMLKPVLNDPK